MPKICSSGPYTHTHTHPPLPHLEFVCLSADFEQLSDGVHKALKVVVTHPLNAPVMAPDPPVQLPHEHTMLLSIVH